MRALPFVGAWLALLAMTLRARYRDPFGPSLQHPGHGENLPGDVAMVLTWGTVEVALLALVIWPWRRKSLATRTGIVGALYAPWALVASVMTMHAGTILTCLALWRFILALVLIIAAVRLTRSPITPGAGAG